MASLSTYASKFLSLGSNNNTSNSEYDDDSDPLFRSHLDDANGASLSSSDGLPTLQSTTQHQSNRSNNNSSRPGSVSLAGMSRYSSYGAYGGGNGGYSIYANQNNQRSSKKQGLNVGSSRMMGESIREIDDDDDVDLWRNQRRMGGRVGLDDKHDSYDEDDGLDPSDQEQEDSSRRFKARDRTSTDASTSSVASDGNGNGNVDPFLAEDDLQRGGESSRSRSKSKSSKSRKSTQKDLNQSGIKRSKVKSQKSSKKGWLAHGDESSIISEEETTSTSNRNTLFDSTTEMENEGNGESAIDERRGAKYSLYEDESGGSGSETSRDELKSKSKSSSKNKGKGRAFDSHQDDATVSITLSPNQSRTNAGRGRRARTSSTSSTTSSTSTTSSQELSPTAGTKSIIRLDSYSLPPVPSGDSWAPWPWYLFRLPESIRNALDDRVWERNRERSDEEWGDSNRNRSRSSRRREVYEEEEDSGIKPPGWKEWNDKQAVVAFSLAITSVFVLGGAGGLGARSTPPPASTPSSPAPSSTYLSLFHSIPLLFFLTLLSLTAGFAQFLLLRTLRTLPARIGARVLTVVLVALPVTLALGWAWAFGSSFWDDEEARAGGGWSTTGLRFMSLVPLILAIVFSRMLYSQRNSLSRSLSVLELSSRIISLHPSLLFLSFSLLGGFLLLSIPILTIFSRLFLNGHFAKLRSKEKNGNVEWVWETDLLARWMAYVTFLVWIWIWSIGRGIMRVTISGVVAHWYFEQGGSFQQASDPKHQDEDREGSNLSESGLPGVGGAGVDLYSSESGMMEESLSAPGPSAPGAWDPPSSAQPQSSSTPNPYLDEATSITSIDLVRANFMKATGSSLGTIIRSSFLLTLSYVLLLVSSIARRFARLLITPGTPAFLSPLLHLATLLAGISSIVKGVSEYGLIYVGVTGEGWKKSTKAAGRVTVKFGRKGALDGLIIHSLLSLSSLSLSFLTALAGFLYAAHNLHTPSDAPLIGLLCGIVPWWTLRICGDVIGNAADTLYLCHALDLAANAPETLNEGSVVDQSVQGGKNKEEVRSAFVGPASGLPF